MSLAKKPEGFAAAALFLLTLAIAAYHVSRFHVTLDDAFISFRAALHWSQNGIPDYNPGSVEWVPTNFLWVALLATAHKISRAALPWLSQLLGGLSAFGTISLLFFFRWTPSRFTRWTACFLCAVSALWAAWAFSGLEVPLFSCLLTAGVLGVVAYAQTRRDALLPWAGLMLGLAAATRPDGVVVFASLALGLVGISAPHRALRNGLLAFAAVPVLAALYLWATFGTALPSSYFAKVHGLENFTLGKAYLKNLAAQYHLAAIAPWLLLPFLTGKNRKPLLLMLFTMAVWALWVMAVGGDFMPFHRFFAPLWPILCCYLALSLETTVEISKTHWPQQKNYFHAAVMILVLIAGVFFMRPSFRGPDQSQLREWQIEEMHREQIGRWLAGHFRPDAWIAVKPAGRIPFYSRLRALDFYCLTDRRAARSAEFVRSNWVGHQSVNVGWILERRPKVIILDDHLYPEAKLPEPGSGAGIVEQRWRENPVHERYQAMKTEMGPNLWLQYFEDKGASR